ncbi:MAG: hypothetical protein IJW82_04565, partial [Clostridia bacterium]|nr:hypothetical protein [Clostridia bacterium]
LFLLKLLLIIVAIVAVLGLSICRSLSPAVNSFKELSAVISKYNEDVNTEEIIFNTVSPSHISSTIEKFKTNNRDIFVNKSINYSKMLPYANSEKETINLTYSEFSYLQNTIKGCNDFLVEKNIEKLATKTIFVGAYSSQYYDMILVKVDLGNIISEIDEFEIIKDNFYLSISKNYSGIYNYKINQLQDNDSKIIENFLNGYINKEELFKNYSIKTLATKLYDLYELQFEEFKKYINVDINIE